MIVLIFMLGLKFSSWNFPTLRVLTFKKIKNFYKVRDFLLHIRHSVCSVNVIMPLSGLHRRAILSSYCGHLMQWVLQGVWGKAWGPGKKWVFKSLQLGWHFNIVSLRKWLSISVVLNLSYFVFTRPILQNSHPQSIFF